MEILGELENRDWGNWEVLGDCGGRDWECWDGAERGRALGDAPRGQRRDRAGAAGLGCGSGPAAPGGDQPSTPGAGGRGGLSPAPAVSWQGGGGCGAWIRPQSLGGTPREGAAPSRGETHGHPRISSETPGRAGLAPCGSIPASARLRAGSNPPEGVFREISREIWKSNPPPQLRAAPRDLLPRSWASASPGAAAPEGDSRLQGRPAQPSPG